MPSPVSPVGRHHIVVPLVSFILVLVGRSFPFIIIFGCVENISSNVFEKSAYDCLSVGAIIRTDLLGCFTA